MSDQNEIVSYAIYPGIGIARVGNSPTSISLAQKLQGKYRNLKAATVPAALSLLPAGHPG